MRYILALLMMCAAARGQVRFATNKIMRFDSPISYAEKNYTASMWLTDKWPSKVEIIFDISSISDSLNILIRVAVATNSVAFQVRGNSTKIITAYFEPSRHPKHLVAVRQTNTVLLYLDGELVDTETAKIDSFANAAYKVTCGTYANSVYPNGDPIYAYLNSITDVRVYSRALSASEISEIYHNPWMYTDDPALVLRTCIVTNDTGTALTGIARNYGTGSYGTYSNSPTAAPGKIQTSKPLTMELP